MIRMPSKIIVSSAVLQVGSKSVIVQGIDAKEATAAVSDQHNGSLNSIFSILLPVVFSCS